MNSPANRSRTVPPNRLAGESRPNTLGGIGLPGAVSPLARPWGATVVLTGVVLGALALVLLLWRPA